MASRRTSVSNNDDQEPSYDVFLSHASEDKEPFVAALASTLTWFGVNVWYDAEQIALGDSLSESIDRGLRHARFGIVVLSAAFFQKRWTKRELSGLVAREMADGSRRILPLWLGVSHQEILDFSPPLADVKALVVSDPGDVVAVARQVIAVVRPDIHERHMRQLAVAKLRDEMPRERIPVELIKVPNGPVRHPALPEHLLVRIRLVAEWLRREWDWDINDTIRNFAQEPDPESELRIWERIALTYLCADRSSPEKSRAVAVSLLLMSMGMVEEALETGLTLEEVRGLVDAMRSYSTMPEGLGR